MADTEQEVVAKIVGRQAEINLAYGLLWLQRLDRRQRNDDLASRARALLYQGMTKEDQADGITRAKELMTRGAWKDTNDGD